MAVAIGVLVVVVFFLLIFFGSAVRVLREYERGVIFRLGRLVAQKGPGLIILIPVIDRMVRVDLRTVTLNIPPQEVITRDNVPARVNAVAYFRVIDPNNAIVEVENFLLATSQIAQTTLRSVLGKAELDQLLAERERLNEDLQKIIDEQTEPWGVKVTHRRDQGRRDPRADAEGDGPAGRGRKGAARQDHQLRGRIPGGGEARLRPPTSSPRTRRRSSCATCRRSSRWASTRTRRSSSRCPST